jgi:hypothetical protein
MDRSSCPSRRRRHGRREARPRHKTDRGDQGELDGGLTSGGGRRERRESSSQRGGSASAAQGAGAARQAATQGGQGARGAAFIGARVRGLARQRRRPWSAAQPGVAGPQMGPGGPGAGRRRSEPGRWARPETDR